MKSKIENVLNVIFFDKTFKQTFCLYPINNEVTLISGGIRIKIEVEKYVDIMFSNVSDLTYNFFK